VVHGQRGEVGGPAHGALGTREARHGTQQLLASSPRPLSRQLPAAWLAGISCAHVTDKADSSHSSQWRALFDGKGTQGWEMVGPGELKLDNGELVTYGGMGMLWYSKEKLGNCEIRVVFKLSLPDDNSGVFIRIPERPQTPWDAVNKGYEIQIDNTENEWHRTGCLYSLTKAKAIMSPKVGEWSTMLITLDHKRTIVKIDVETICVHSDTPGADDLAQILGVEPRRQRRRADQIAEHHRQLPPFGIGGSRCISGRLHHRSGGRWGAGNGESRTGCDLVLRGVGSGLLK
jgi:hypothetical protein